MSDRDDKLDAFLRKNVPRAPGAPLGEKERIWRAIEASEASTAWSWRDWRSFLAMPQLRIAVPALAIIVLVLGSLEVKKVRHDREVDRVLAAALSYQLNDNSSDNSLF